MQEDTLSNNLSYSQKGLALTAQFEGLRLTAYQDSVGVWTIGYGHTGADVHPSLSITQQQASDLLLKDVASAVAAVNRFVRVPLTQNQFDALVDFVFNLGAGTFSTSTLLRELNNGNFAAAAAQFPLWVHAKHEILPGLVTRRKAEQALFLEADAAAANSSGSS
jgi:lysozyme